MCSRERRPADGVSPGWSPTYNETPRPSPPTFFSILLSGLDFWIDFCVRRSAFPRLVDFLSCNPMWLKTLTSTFWYQIPGTMVVMGEESPYNIMVEANRKKRLDLIDLHP